jgi:hypothetical protein
VRAATLAVLIALAVSLCASAATLAPREHQRLPDQTFLTYPEWFLVFSPAEFATFVRSNPPSEFPFFGHIRQFWQGYDAVWNQTRGRYPFNGGYHLMIMVIGSSTTMEYAFRSVYETLVGRLAELTRTHGMTDEERLGARYAQEYVDFIRVDPWYEFDFTSRLHHLWLDTSLTGPDMIRKWERKYALTSELGVKAIYGYLIKLGTKTVYDPALPTTAVVIDRLPASPIANLVMMQRYSDGSALVTIPRYEGFLTAATELARQGVQFREIAGNRGPILLSMIEHGNAPAALRDTAFLRQPIITEAGKERLLVTVPVGKLSPALNSLRTSGVQVEHVFDY